MNFLAVIVGLTLVTLSSASLDTRPLIIGHRGAPEYVPEHSVASYAIAIREGVDYIEPDLQITKDGRYICMHDPELSVMTDVADHPEFASRFRTVTFPTGVQETGWFVPDFSLAEIKTLRLKQRLAIRDQIYNGLFQVITIEEACDALADRNKQLNLTVGIYIEPKHPTWYTSLNLTFDNLVPTLAQKGYVMNGPGAKTEKIFLESFETSHLQKLRTQTDVRLIMLVDQPLTLQEDTLKPFGDLFTTAGLDLIQKFADGIGPFKRWFYTAIDAEFLALAQKTNAFTGAELVEQCHKRGLHLHPWTVRNRTEDIIVDQLFSGIVYKEYEYLFNIGVDGVFTENAGTAIEARDNYVKARNQLTNGVSVGGAVAIAFVMAGTFFVIGAFSYRFYMARRSDYGKV